METESSSLWNELNPLWIFRCSPADCRPFGRSLCPGLFWLHGCSALFGLHLACFAALFTASALKGFSSSQLWFLSPVAAIWLVFGLADLKFRLLRPSREEREVFDNAVLNWFGFVSFIIGGLALMGGAVVWLLASVWRWATH